MLRSLLLAVLAYSLVLVPGLARGQVTTTYDASWYDPDAPYVRLAVAEDGVYRVTGEALQSALPEGTTLDDIPRSTMRLYENGREIPIHLSGASGGSFDSSDALHFVGHRNRGTDEQWAYETPTDQSSPYRSLYTDTTHYWLTWGGETTGRRYSSPSFESTTPTSTLRDTVHLEQENRYYYGRPYESGDSFYTESEGYYWRRFSHNDTGTIQSTYTLPVSRHTNSSDSLHLSVRLDAETNSCHRVRVEAELQQSGGDVAFESLSTVEWQGYQRQTVEAAVAQNRIPDDLRVRLVSINENFSDSNCPDPGSTPNYVLLDYLEANYVRRLAADGDTQRFVAPAGTNYTFSLSGHSSDSVEVYNPADARRYQVSAASGPANVSVSPSNANTPFWAVGQQSYKSPASLQPDESSNWSVASAHGADYVILTTEALQSSAQSLAEYRRTQSGYEVAVVEVQNVFDEFDYGRPTPIAIRRFARTTQEWTTPPQFLTIFADAEFPIDPGLSRPRADWSVPAFGYSVSDGWYAMQATGPNDWTEFLAIGRIPVRNNAQGELFVDKLSAYENSEPAAWQKRMLLMAGGTSESEQNSLQFYSNQWGELATGTPDTIYAAGMDTLRYYKQVDDALDTSFQDSLSADLERGTGWLSYFGHSAARTWEIVTDPPREWDNSGKLPVILSLGCKTGSYAGDQFGERGAPALGEQFVVGSLSDDGTPVEGARNGGIAHWGTSALGNRLPSARLGDELTQRVFTDTMRVLGTAIQQAKAAIARDFGSSSLYQRHLLTYGLLGDPATRISLPDQPELSVQPRNIQTSPTRPILSEPLTVDVSVDNFGLVPSDSVNLSFRWQRPDGSQVQRSQNVPRFRLSHTTSFNLDTDNRAVGTNQFQATVDPANQYDEVDETNNTASQEQVVFGTGLILISPSPEGAVPTQRPILRTNLLRQTSGDATVEIQIDSVSSFDSPGLQETTQETGDLVVDWTPPRDLRTNQTYFWRARPVTDEESAWRESQFTVKSAETSLEWFQTDQLFQNNTHTRLRPMSGTWSFGNYAVSVRAVSDRPGATNGASGFVVNTTQRYLRLALGFGVLVLDGVSGAVKAVDTFPTYDLPDDLEGENGDQQQAINALRSFLDTNVDEGDYVFVRTRHFARQSSATIPSEVKDLFRNLGSSSSVDHTTAIDTLTYDHLWILEARKGDPSATKELVSPPSESDDVRGILRESELSFRHASGRTLTQRIGPSQSWDHLEWDVQTEGSEEIQVDVLAAQDSSVLRSTQAGVSGELSLSSIEADTHPYLLFRATLTDSTERTAPQLREWGASFTPVPELSVDPSSLARLPDTLRLGETLSPTVSVRHLSGPPASNVRLEATLTDPSNQTTPVRTDTLGTLEIDSTASVDFDVSTDQRQGTNTLTVTTTSDASPERVSFNNTALHTFRVQPDDRPPSLKVLAEGRELPPTADPIQNLQDPSLPFVSTNPTLEIQIQDDNPYLRLQDTSYVEVYLKEGLPSDGPDLISNYRRIPFSGPSLTFNPAEEEAENTARVLFEPTLPAEDQTYTLKVEAQDAQGNEGEPYTVTFRVQQQQVIEDLYPYPNPMSDHTQFSFLIRGGNTRPSDFRLRIYTLSGRLVREFTGAEANDGAGLRTTGWNHLTWDGRDADGDRVATGVYLYRVRMEGANGTFEGDVEKVVVIR